MIVVTGGAGFIGSNIVAALAEKGSHEVVVSDRLGEDERWRNLAKHEIADLIPPEGLFDYLARYTDRVETIIHMGAITSTTESNVDRLVTENVRFSLDLWSWCARTATRLIYASSAATYGDGAMGFDDDGSVAGLARLRPLNAYGWSKHVVDRRIARLVESNAPRPPQWVGLKFFNVYGPNEYHKGAMKSVVAQIFPAARAGGPARLFKSRHPDYADGGQRRDFIAVEDCVAVIDWLIDHPGVSGIYNLGTGQARSFADLAGATFAALERHPEIEYIETPEEMRERYQYFTEARMGRLREAGYARPFTSLEDGVGRYVRKYLASDDPYR